MLVLHFDIVLCNEMCQWPAKVLEMEMERILLCDFVSKVNLTLIDDAKSVKIRCDIHAQSSTMLFYFVHLFM